MRVTKKYGISSPVPFVNVHIDHDNRLFVDPSGIRNATDPWSRRAHNLLLDFFSEVLRCRASTSAIDHAKGLALLNELHEPNETRFGMSRSKIAGHGFGPDLAQRLWDELGSNAAARTHALTRLEELHLCVRAVGPDLISDLATRIIFEVLVDFTHTMMGTYPSLAKVTSTEVVSMYDPTSKTWRPRTVELPFVHPHQLLLVPRGWVFWRLLMDAEAFYNRFGTGTVQTERITFDSKNRAIRQSKASLRAEFVDHKGLNTRQASKYAVDDRNLFAEYRAQVDAEFEELDSDQIDHRIGR